MVYQNDIGEKAQRILFQTSYNMSRRIFHQLINEYMLRKYTGCNDFTDWTMIFDNFHNCEKYNMQACKKEKLINYYKAP